MKHHPHSEAAWRSSIARGRLEDNRRARRSGATWFILSALVSVGVIAAGGTVREGGELQRCANGEIHMPAWERGLDGALQRRGTYCYRADPDEMKGLWTIGDDDLPVNTTRRGNGTSQD